MTENEKAVSYQPEPEEKNMQTIVYNCFVHLIFR